MEKCPSYRIMAEEVLTEKELEFTTEDRGSTKKFLIHMPSKYFFGLETYLLVDESGDIMYRCYLALDVPMKNRVDTILECNRLNSAYKYISLYVDKDGDLCSAYDCSLYDRDEESVKTNIIATLYRCHLTTEECIPHLMKLIWANCPSDADQRAEEICKLIKEGGGNN